MDTLIYTEDELRALKYATLMKITKDRGLKTTGRRVKTEKLIEMIIEAQNVPDIATDVAAVCAALETANNVSEEVVEATSQSDELLADIEFPEEPSPETEPPKELVTTRRRGRARRKQDAEDITDFKELKEVKLQNMKSTAPEKLSTLQREAKAETNSDKKQQSLKKVTSEDDTITAQGKKRRRTRTFDKEEKMEVEEEQPKAFSKRSRTSTFEVAETKEESSQIKKQSKRQRTSTFELPAKELQNPIPPPEVVIEKAEEPQRVSRRKSSMQQDSKGSEREQIKLELDAGEKQEASDLVAAVASPKLPSKSNTPRLSSIAKRKSLIITPAATPPVIHKVQRMIQGSAKTPSSDAKKLGAKIVKPVFTVGRSDGPTKNEPKDSKKDGSNIPRFLSYARKIKVPNFAKIHERAFNRMEALDDFDKKRKRTNTVGSSVKKPQVDPEKVFKPAVTSVKNLNFNFAGSTKSSAQFGKTPSGNKIETKSPAQFGKTPRGKIGTKSPRITTKSPKVTKNSAKTIPGKSPKLMKKSPKVAVTSTKVKTMHKSPKTLALKSPGPVKNTPKLEQKQEARTTSSKKVSTARPSGLPRLLKENVKPATGSVVSPAGPKLGSKSAQTPGSTKKVQEANSKMAVGKPAGYVPYKGVIKPFSDRATLKNMAERNPNIKSREQIREGHKKILKGVRFNKRFELQMAKRGISLKE